MFCDLFYLSLALAFLAAITFVQVGYIQPIADNPDFRDGFEVWGWWGCAFGIWGFHPQLLLSSTFCAVKSEDVNGFPACWK